MSNWAISIHGKKLSDERTWKERASAQLWLRNRLAAKASPQKGCLERVTSKAQPQKCCLESVASKALLRKCCCNPFAARFFFSYLRFVTHISLMKFFQNHWTLLVRGHWTGPLQCSRWRIELTFSYVKNTTFSVYLTMAISLALRSNRMHASISSRKPRTPWCKLGIFGAYTFGMELTIWTHCCWFSQESLAVPTIKKGRRKKIKIKIYKKFLWSVLIS